MVTILQRPQFLFSLKCYPDTNTLPACIRDLVLKRLHKVGLETLRLPLGAGPEDPHVPILVSPDLHLRKRVVVIFNEHTQELGVWALREIGSRSTVNKGSTVDLVRYLQTPTNGHRPSDCPGIILANPGQLLWYRKGKRAISHAQRHVLPRKSAVHPPVTMASEKNLIPCNESPEEHVAYIFREVIPTLCNPGAELNIIGVSDAADIVAKYLDKHCKLVFTLVCSQVFAQRTAPILSGSREVLHFASSICSNNTTIHLHTSIQILISVSQQRARQAPSQQAYHSHSVNATNVHAGRHSQR